MTQHATYQSRKVENPDHLVIFLHGYGSNGDDLLGLAPEFEGSIPKAVFVGPNALTPLPGYPGGYQWFPISGMDPVLLQKGCESAWKKTVQLIQDLQSEFNMLPEQTTLIGFSQGTMMALYCALRHQRLCKRVLGFSGALCIDPEHIQAKPADLEIQLIHGEMDPVVPLEGSIEAQAFLKKAGFHVEFTSCPRLGHSIDRLGIRVAKQFLVQKRSA